MAWEDTTGARQKVQREFDRVREMLEENHGADVVAQVLQKAADEFRYPGEVTDLVALFSNGVHQDVGEQKVVSLEERRGQMASQPLVDGNQTQQIFAIGQLG